MLPRISLCFAVVLMVLIGVLSATRRQGEGIYFLLSNEGSVYSQNLYFQSLELGQAERRPVKALNNARGIYNTLVNPPDFWRADDNWLYFGVYNGQGENCLHRARFTGNKSYKIACHYMDEGYTDIYNTFFRSYDGNWFAYVYSFPNDPQILLTRADGSQTRILLSQFDMPITGLVWSSDDQWLYFTSIKQGVSPAVTTLYRINVADGDLEMIGEGGSWFVPYKWYWLNDEYLLLDDWTSILVFNVQTKQLTLDLPNARWLWDKQRNWLFYTHFVGMSEQDDIFRIRPDGTEQVRITDFLGNEPIIGFIGATRYILFYANGGIYRMDADGQNIQRLYEGSASDGLIYGEWMYFVKYGNYADDEIYRLNVEGKIEKLASHPFLSSELTITPDSKYLVVATNRHYYTRIFYMRLDGSDQHSLQVSREYGEPFFSPVFDPLTWHSRQLIWGSIALMVMSLVYWKRKFA